MMDEEKIRQSAVPGIVKFNIEGNNYLVFSVPLVKTRGLIVNVFK